MSIHQFFTSAASTTFTRRSSPRATAKAPARCSRIDHRPDAPPRSKARWTTRRISSTKPAYLTVSGQLQGEAFACALGRIYTFGPTFRAENSNTPRHLAEFWMIETGDGVLRLTDNMDLAEAFLKRIISDAAEVLHGRPQVLREKLENKQGVFTKLDNVLNNPFKRVSYTEGVDILLKSGKKWEYPVSWGVDLQSEHERYLAEQYFQVPGDPVRLPTHAEAVLHEGERRPKDGCERWTCWCGCGRDHRR